MAFVANLQKQYLRQQFALFCWVHMTLLVIVVSRYVDVTKILYRNSKRLTTGSEFPISHFIVNNILEGLIWFFVPASLVICNDVMAYVCGESTSMLPMFVAERTHPAISQASCLAKHLLSNSVQKRRSRASSGHFSVHFCLRWSCVPIAKDLLQARVLNSRPII